MLTALGITTCGQLREQRGLLSGVERGGKCKIECWALSYHDVVFRICICQVHFAHFDDTLECSHAQGSFCAHGKTSYAPDAPPKTPCPHSNSPLSLPLYPLIPCPPCAPLTPTLTALFTGSASLPFFLCAALGLGPTQHEPPLPADEPHRKVGSE